MSLQFARCMKSNIEEVPEFKDKEDLVDPQECLFRDRLCALIKVLSGKFLAACL